MACCWEIGNQATVLVGILHTENVSMGWALGLRQLRIPRGVILPTAGMPFDHARNHCVMRALEMGCSHVFFLDSDVIPPPDTIERLLAHNLPIVSGTYFRRSPPHGIMVAQRPLGNWVTKWQKGSLIEVDVVGTGCLLVQTEVFEKMKPIRPGKHWYCWMVDMPKEQIQQGEGAVSEDFAWCIAAKKQLGIPTIVDTGIVCRHVGFSQYTHNDARPLELGMIN